MVNTDTKRTVPSIGVIGWDCMILVSSGPWKLSVIERSLYYKDTLYMSVTTGSSVYVVVPSFFSL